MGGRRWGPLGRPSRPLNDAELDVPTRLGFRVRYPGGINRQTWAPCIRLAVKKEGVGAANAPRFGRLKSVRCLS